MTQLCVFSAVFHEHSGDKDGFCHRAFRWSGRLERLTRSVGEAVQIQTVIPVSTPDQRKVMRSFMVDNIAEGARQMLKERSSRGFIVVKRNLLIKNGEISGLLDIGSSTCDQPERVVIEAAADVHVAFFGERLILMVCAAVLKLSGGNVNNTFLCALRNQMYEAEQILT